MEITLLDEFFKPKAVIENYESLIWTDKCAEYGDFELFLNYWIEDIILSETYLQIKHSDKTMIIEKIEKNIDVEKGKYSILKGRSLESILCRRIIWKHKIYKGKPYNVISDIIDDCFANPTDKNRKINYFGNLHINFLTDMAGEIKKEYTGDNCYDIINKICCENELKFDLIINKYFDGRDTDKGPLWRNYKFVFCTYPLKYNTLKKREDSTGSSYYRDISNLLHFSHKQDNILSIKYAEDTIKYKNTYLVGGEGEGDNRKYICLKVNGRADIGINRNEVFVDARDISSKKENDVVIPISEYENLLENRATEKSMTDFKNEIIYDAEISKLNNYKYLEDYKLGDEVVIDNIYDNKSKECIAVIKEVTISYNKDGVTIFPRFEISDSINNLYMLQREELS